ncbi:HD-GYP domain-containing protein [Moorella sp. Hama-1]|uniref:HD-GYP domain-containing protein n=1 Tax=Moorella sp. Hama-1 TaxID=2138101 RepID=UPI000D6470E7|nr:HD domain-containing phosphohydrolase [Moorella sp. Hama-1]BCV21085.1 hypothetical protein hamaS1_11540 [Moorella sp. Hama-1]
MESNTVAEILDEIQKFWPELYFHSISVANLALRMAVDLSVEEVHYKDILVGALLHDAGKTKIKREILQKPGPLTSTEWKEIKRHPRYGAEWIENRGGNSEVAAIIRYHHEKWNGEGYVGLKRHQIPFFARIVAIADALDAMTAPRPYRQAVEFSRALAEIHIQAGLQFDASVLSRLRQKDTYRPETYSHPRTIEKQKQVEKNWLQRLIEIYGDSSHPLIIAQSHWVDKLVAASYQLSSDPRGDSAVQV